MTPSPRRRSVVGTTLVACLFVVSACAQASLSPSPSPTASAAATGPVDRAVRLAQRHRRARRPTPTPTPTAPAPSPVADCVVKPQEGPALVGPDDQGRDLLDGQG